MMRVFPEGSIVSAINRNGRVRLSGKVAAATCIFTVCVSVCVYAVCVHYYEPIQFEEVGGCTRSHSCCGPHYIYPGTDQRDITSTAFLLPVFFSACITKHVLSFLLKSEDTLTLFVFLFCYGTSCFSVASTVHP